MAQANTLLNIWGPALLVCFTVIVGLFYQNTRMNDQNTRMADLRDSLNKRIDDMRDSINARIDGLQKYMETEFKRVDERIERLEILFVRK